MLMISDRMKTRKKAFRKYAIEFLLIFLAVMAGAITENYREDLVERKEVRQYARSLVNDLLIDTTEISRARLEKQWLASVYDSAMKIIDAGVNNANGGYLYYASRYLMVNDVFNCQDVTFQQLQGSGNFRYFENEMLYREISDYYKLNRRYTSLEGKFGYTDLPDMAELNSLLFDLSALHELDNVQQEVVFSRIVRRPGPAMPPVKKDPVALRRFYSRLAEARHRSLASVNFLGLLRHQATVLAGHLEAEFELSTD